MNKEMNTKGGLIFLDFDGVLNNDYTFSRSGRRRRLQEPLEPNLIKRVGDLAKDTDSKIVLSTAWRNLHSMPYLKSLLASGIEPSRIIGRTPWLDKSTRGYEILSWLYNKGRDNQRFVVLDDNDYGPFDMGPVRRHFVQTDPVLGVTGHDIRRAKLLLEHGPVWKPRRAA